MAVGKTGAIFKTFTFNGESSKDYGVYITGEAVYNAPERAVEMITIPGRNGAFALDQKRFENIEVTYPAGMFAENEEDFAEGISDLRNMLCSTNGYCRLTDDYNPDEYRLAIYKSGLEVEPWRLRSGEFSITFECQPQRYLLTGDSAVTVANNGTITNPTLFDSKPMLEVTGYGDIDINSDIITVNNAPIGDVIVYRDVGQEAYRQTGTTIVFDTQYANNGDAISVASPIYHTEVWQIDSGTITNISSSASGAGTATSGLLTPNYQIGATARLNPITFTYGTSSTKTVTGTFAYTSSVYGTLNCTLGFSASYNGSNTITFTPSRTLATHISELGGAYYFEKIGDITLSSSQPILGNPLYIDLDIGEAYKIEGGSPVSANNGVIIPAKLPTLKPGSNTISFDNTFTKVNLTPRWWQV